MKRSVCTHIPIYSSISASTTIGTYVLPDGTVYEGQYRDGVAVGIHREKLGNAPTWFLLSYLTFEGLVPNTKKLRK